MRESDSTLGNALPPEPPPPPIPARQTPQDYEPNQYFGNAPTPETFAPPPAIPMPAQQAPQDYQPDIFFGNTLTGAPQVLPPNKLLYDDSHGPLTTDKIAEDARHRGENVEYRYAGRWHSASPDEFKTMMRSGKYAVDWWGVWGDVEIKDADQSKIPQISKFPHPADKEAPGEPLAPDVAAANKNAQGARGRLEKEEKQRAMPSHNIIFEGGPPKASSLPPKSTKPGQSQPDQFLDDETGLTGEWSPYKDPVGTIKSGEYVWVSREYDADSDTYRDHFIYKQDIMKELYHIDPVKIAEWQVRLNNVPTGIPDTEIEKQWKDATERASRYTASGVRVDPMFLFEQAMRQVEKGKRSSGGGGGYSRRGGGGGGGGGSAMQSAMLQPAVAKAYLTNAFQKEAGRDPTADEIAAFQGFANGQTLENATQVEQLATDWVRDHAKGEHSQQNVANYYQALMSVIGVR